MCNCLWILLIYICAGSSKSYISDHRTIHECEDGWHMFMESDSCYKVVVDRQKMKWLDAKRECRLLGGRLVTIGSREEYDFLLEKIHLTLESLDNGEFGVDSNPYIVGDDFVHIGLTKDFTQEPGVFKDGFIWEDGAPLTFRTWAKEFRSQVSQPNGANLETCTAMLRREGWHDIGCGDPVGIGYICEKQSGNSTQPRDSPVLSSCKDEIFDSSLYMKCENGEILSTLRQCDGTNDCLDGTDERNCSTSCSAQQYQCTNGRCVSISFYCDYFDDCGDSSDEKECVPEPCSEGWVCANGQCISKEKRCDLIDHCVDGSDERECDTCNDFDCYNGRCIPNFWKNDDIVDCDGRKMEDELCPPEKPPPLNLTVSSTKTQCPAGFYKCPGTYCIPAYLVCNGRQDCPIGEDEINCESYTCPGYYRCQKSRSSESHCIHHHELCDNIVHCPGGDDERLCDLTCPPECSCYGLSIECHKAVSHVESFPKRARRIEFRDFNLSATGLRFEGFYFLQTLTITNCSLSSVPKIVGCPNLRYLNLSHNAIEDIQSDTFKDLRLTYLDISGNKHLTNSACGSFQELRNLKKLHLSDTDITHLKSNALIGMSVLENLVISKSSLKYVDEGAFNGLNKLETLDIRENDIDVFSEHIFKGLDNLKILQTGSSSLCCDAIRPPSVSREKCFSPRDKISSCADLMGVDTLRIFLWVLGILALVGNLAVFGFRLRYDRTTLRKGYGIFITNLCIADFIMGIYLMIIAGADLTYRGRYVWHAQNWRQSMLCQFGGFLSTLSSEASCLFICLVTLDRLLVIKFPFGQVRFSMRWAVLASVFTWLLSITYAAVPFLPVFKSWAFYTQNSVCLPLPFSDERTAGWYYAFSAFVCFNCITFCVIVFGQVFIYREVTSSIVVKDEKRSEQEFGIAKRLFLIVFTDFCCWFPVGVLGILAATGTEIPDTIYAWTVVFILPVNSALNPMMYTLPFVTQMKKPKSKSNYIIHQNDKVHANLAHRLTSSTDVDGDNSITSSGVKGVWSTVDPKVPSLYIGQPRDDMVTLGYAVRSNRLMAITVHEILCMILAVLRDKGANGEEVLTFSEDNIYVKTGTSAGKVEEVCLSPEMKTKKQQ